MSELRTLLSETTARVLAGLGGQDFASAWARVEGAGLQNVLVPEDRTGFGGGWEDALVVLRASGACAVALPIAEAVLACRLISDADLILPDGSVTLAGSARGRVRMGKFTGEMRNVPFGRNAGSLAGILEDRGASTLVVAECREAVAVERRDNPAGEPRDTLQFEGANVQVAPIKMWSGEKLFRHLALVRSCQMAGALQAALDLAVQYTRERTQFGKPLASFQAIQQQLAVFAEETAAANAAAAAACRAADRGDAAFAMAAAKLRANQAVGIATNIAHQVHGAMGFTAEYPLQRFTRRLWAWRSEYGNDRYWADEIGARVAARGPDNFWPDLVGGFAS